MVIVGTARGEALHGTTLADRISGLGGPDDLFGGSGADRINGGFGHDVLRGGEGGDRLMGGGGDDVIYGFGTSDVRAQSADIALSPLGSFNRPTFATSAPGDPDRLYVVEQHTGRVMILDTQTGRTLPTPFLDLADNSLADGNEQGLLGLAFDPGYARNGRFYVYLTQADGDIEVRGYHRSAGNPDRADAGSADTILQIDRDNGAANHNGGWIGFGPDRMLYVAVGDEGLTGDPANNAQNPDELWGKMLRIDVHGDDFASTARDYAIPDDNPFAAGGGAGEVWALGLRNPWRNSFDRATGDLYIGDVGQAEREEIDVQAAGSRGGENYGWKVKEGTLVYDASDPDNPPPNSPSLIDPVTSYAHDASGGFAVIGGYVYRGGGGMQGRYLYADDVSGNLWSFKLVGGRAVDVTSHTGQLVGGTLDGITSFAEDGRGVLYAMTTAGTLSRLGFGRGAGDGADVIDGGAGDDRLYGGAGHDVIAGGSGRDAIAGGAQADVLHGNTGADRLDGGPGADWLSGDYGRDVLRGRAGADTFHFAPNFGHDTVADFQDDVDTVQLDDRFGFATAREALAVAHEAGGDVVFDFAAGTSLTVQHATIAALADDLVV